MSESVPTGIRPEAWYEMLAAADQLGCGKYTFGSMYADGTRPDHLTIHFHTLVPASLYASPDRLKDRPITFERAPGDAIVLPGRWWQNLIGGTSRCDDVPPELLTRIAQDVAGAGMVNALVPATSKHGPGASDTLLASLSDLAGNVVVQEILRPGTEAFVPFPPVWQRLLRGEGNAEEARLE